VRQRGRLPLDEVARIVSQVARALGRAHAAGIIHRDIKPPNIFLCELGGGDKFVKLLDFGIAKKELATNDVDGGGDELTKTEALLGTPHYASPEQILSAKHIDARSDLWSLGVVAYYCLTGVRPFEGPGIGAISVAVCKGEHVPASGHEPSIPKSFDAWFAKACALRPEERFQTVDEMAESLVALASGAALSPAAGEVVTFAPASPHASEAQATRAALETLVETRRATNVRLGLLAGVLLAGAGLIVALRLPSTAGSSERASAATSAAPPVGSRAGTAASSATAPSTIEVPSVRASATEPAAASAPLVVSAAPPIVAPRPTTPTSATARPPAAPKATAPKKYADDI
jgi:serine/threonine-protein kinase